VAYLSKLTVPATPKSFYTVDVARIRGTEFLRAPLVGLKQGSTAPAMFGRAGKLRSPLWAATRICFPWRRRAVQAVAVFLK
jgi:hypothetical protein